MGTPRCIAQVVVMFLLPLSAHAAIAQQVVGTGAGCAPRTSGRGVVQPPPIDVYATLEASADSTDVPAMYLATLLQEVRDAFALPDTIAGLSDGTLEVWLQRDGRLTSARATDSLLPADLASALMRAMDSVSRGGGIGPVFPGMRADSVSLSLVVHGAEETTPHSIPMFRVSRPPVFSEIQVEKAALAVAGNPRPKIPPSLLKDDLGGEVVAQFVVDERGRADMTSFQALRSSHPDLTWAVRDVLPRMRFHPAEVNGCKVRQVTKMTFGFQVTRELYVP